MIDKYTKFLTEDCGYLDARIRDNKFDAIYPLAFTYAIITGKAGNVLSFEDRWCYQTYEAAKNALDAWDGTGEPKGWHRHPASGRRVDENGREYIAA